MFTWLYFIYFAISWFFLLYYVYFIIDIQFYFWFLSILHRVFTQDLVWGKVVIISILDIYVFDASFLICDSTLLRK